MAGRGWWMVGLALAAASTAAAAPYQGFATLAAGQGSAIVLRLRVTGATGRGEILRCADPGPCAFAGARLDLMLAGWPSQREEQSRRLEGTLHRPDGIACTLTGDAWTVRARGRRVPDGGMSATVRCPDATGSLQLWVRGYRFPDGDV